MVCVVVDGSVTPVAWRFVAGDDAAVPVPDGGVAGYHLNGCHRGLRLGVGRSTLGAGWGAGSGSTAGLTLGVDAASGVDLSSDMSPSLKAWVHFLVMPLHLFADVRNVTFVFNPTPNVPGLYFLGAKCAFNPTAAAWACDADTGGDRGHWLPAPCFGVGWRCDVVAAYCDGGVWRHSWSDVFFEVSHAAVEVARNSPADLERAFAVRPVVLKSSGGLDIRRAYLATGDHSCASR